MDARWLTAVLAFDIFRTSEWPADASVQAECQARCDMMSVREATLIARAMLLDRIARTPLPPPAPPTGGQGKLNPSDPWYMPYPHKEDSPDTWLRWRRAHALAQMRQYLNDVSRSSSQNQHRRRHAIEYRRKCLANWEAYLNGEIRPPNGKRLKAAKSDR
jgi:hypothetical protein